MASTSTPYRAWVRWFTCRAYVYWPIYYANFIIFEAWLCHVVEQKSSQIYILTPDTSYGSRCTLFSPLEVFIWGAIYPTRLWWKRKVQPDEKKKIPRLLKHKRQSVVAKKKERHTSDDFGVITPLEPRNLLLTKFKLTMSPKGFPVIKALRSPRWFR